MTTHSTRSTFTTGMAFSTRIDAHTVITDTVPAEGGEDSGASPKKLMLGALAGCTGIDVVSILNKSKVRFSDLSIEITATLTDQYPKIYNNVLIKYNIKMDEADKPKMEKAVKLSEEKYCGVNAMFRAFAEVKHEIVYL